MPRISKAAAMRNGPAAPQYRAIASQIDAMMERLSGLVAQAGLLPVVFNAYANYP